MADIVAHNWPDVIYLALLIAVAVFNVLHNTKVSRKADDASAGVVDVKRATGLVKRAEDPDPVEPPTDTYPPTAPHRRITDQ